MNLVLSRADETAGSRGAAARPVHRLRRGGAERARRGGRAAARRRRVRAQAVRVHAALLDGARGTPRRFGETFCVQRFAPAHNDVETNQKCVLLLDCRMYVTLKRWFSGITDFVLCRPRLTTGS